MEKICGIYKITSPSGKVYIGQSTNCLHRLKQYKWHRCKKQAKLYASIIKYGWENHKYEIIHRCEESELNEMEIHYAKIFDVHSKKNGLNIRECGGSKGRHSKESIEKCRVAKIGKKNSTEHVANVSAALKEMYRTGEIKPWNKGLKGVQIPSKESLEKRRKSMIGKNKSEEHTETIRETWRKRKSDPNWDSEESKKQRSIKLGLSGANHPLAKIVLDTETGIFYGTVKEAAASIKMDYNALIRRLNGTVKAKTKFIYA